MNISIIAGARPNFVKIAPIIEALEQKKRLGYNVRYRLIHTGQHYDINMSKSFFQELNIPEPDVNLNCGGGSQAEQTSNIMLAFEKELSAHPADLVLVVGDVTSTLACSIVAKKLCTKVAHVEAGIRSGDLSMPEEINRIVTDSITDFFFTTSEIAGDNLRKIGVSDERIFFVGNTMIDSLLKYRSHFQQPDIWKEVNLQVGRYLVLTLHRPGNVDDEEKLRILINEIVESSRSLPIIFPVHPRTSKMLNKMRMQHSTLHTISPLSYLQFNYLVEHSMAVITDSGGITEETSVMRIPCMTLRPNTERPETVTFGTNELLGTNVNSIRRAMDALFAGQWKKGSDIPLWDGKSAKRIVDYLLTLKIDKDEKG